MTRHHFRFEITLVLAIATTNLLAGQSTALAAPFADLTGWVGNHNVAFGNNNYDVTPPTTAGGQFQRRAPDAYLADTSLAVAVNDQNPFSASGTITIDTPGSGTAIDPSWILGFFTSSNLSLPAYGLSLADTPSFNAIRVQASVGNNDGANGGGTALVDGTYAFNISYNPAIGGGTLAVDIGGAGQTVTGLATTAHSFNAFGFLQRGGLDALPTFDVSISNINYTGDTLVPEPSSFALLALGTIGIANLARRRGTRGDFRS